MMRLLRVVGLSILVACGALPVAVAAQDKGAAVESKAVIHGEVILRTPDPQRGLVYLRLREEDGRVWLFAVSPDATAVTQDGKEAADDLLTEGVYVEAELPRGVEGIPVAYSIAMLPAPARLPAEDPSIKR